MTSFNPMILFRPVGLRELELIAELIQRFAKS